MEDPKPPKTLIICTAAIMIALISGVLFFEHQELPPAIALSTKDQPTLGFPKAPVHVVVFEEPKCSHCRKFNSTIFPELKKNYIDTNKIQYTVIPVSFLSGSMPAATALLCVYNQDPKFPNDELFVKFLDSIYEKQPRDKSDWATTKNLVAFAKETSPAIDTKKLSSCIERERWRTQIVKNTRYGNKIMGRITTPTVYVNGMQVESLSYSEVSQLINTALGKLGIAINEEGEDQEHD